MNLFDDNVWYCVYIMASPSGTLYIGSTCDLQRRVWQHKEGLIAGFTKKYGCTRLVYFERHAEPIDAVTRERRLEGWTRAKKVALIESQNPRWQDLARNWGRPMALPGEAIRDAERQLREAKKLVLQDDVAREPGNASAGKEPRDPSAAKGASSG